MSGRFPQTRNSSSPIYYSGKIKKTFRKERDVNSRLKNYCQQKYLDFLDSSNMLEKHLGNRKLDLNKRGNSVSVNSFIKYLRSFFGILDDFICVRNFQAECGSQQVLEYLEYMVLQIMILRKA